jgi:ABC-type multidrug transport system, permease component
MITFLTVLKTNYQRAWTRMIPYAVITIISMGSILLGTYLSNHVRQFAHVAVIGQETILNSITSSKRIKVIRMEKKPPLSDLYEQKYDAYLFTDAQGELKIETLKSKEFKTILLALLNNPDTPITGNYKERGTGQSIVGFMLMFLLMISFSNMTYFSDDKEQGQLGRIFAAPVSFFWYIAANLVFSLSLFLPQFLLIAEMKLCGVNIGFRISQFLLFFLIIGFLGSTVALFLNTLIQKPDNANMLGNSITVLASILSGAFYSFSRNNAVLDTIIKILPQKQILNIAENIDGSMTTSFLLSMIYVIAFSTILLVLSCIILQKKYVKRA